MKKTIIALVTLLAVGLGVYLWSNMDQVPEPVTDENGRILSDPVNQARSEYLAPMPDSIMFE